MTFWAASGFLWQHLASFIKNKIKQSKNKAICYHILIFTVLKEQRVASSQKIHQGRCFTFIKGQRDNCLFSKMNLPVLYIPWKLSRNDYDVKYLNLDCCTADQGVLEKLISSCKSLQKLSLCNLELNSNAMKMLGLNQQNQIIQVLLRMKY